MCPAKQAEGENRGKTDSLTFTGLVWAVVRGCFQTPDMGFGNDD